MLDFEQQFTQPSRRARVIRPVPRQDLDDEEMGFLPLLMEAIPAVAGLASSLLGMKSKKHGGGPPPEAYQAQSALSMLKGAIGGSSGQSVKDVVRQVVQSTPSPVQGQVIAALRQIANERRAQQLQRNQVASAVKSSVGPQVDTIYNAVRRAEQQRQATYEHQKIVANQQFKKQTVKGIVGIAKRLDNIEKRLNRSAIVSGQSRINLFGGRNALEGG